LSSLAAAGGRLESSRHGYSEVGRFVGASDLIEPHFTEADRAYLGANYVLLEDLCASRDESPADIRQLIEDGVLPRPSYTVDGVGMFPADYFQLYDEAGGREGLRNLFAERYCAAAAAHPDLATREAVDSAWRAYLAGVWGQCLCEVRPETIVRKRALVNSLCKLIALPRPGSEEWQEQLRAEVTELDRIERDFAPDYDRVGEWNERPPSRDLLINVARQRFPEVFACDQEGLERSEALAGAKRS
jgi:Family of unknown function (DUF6058)